MGFFYGFDMTYLVFIVPCIIITLMANFDRHWGNFGVIVETETRRWVGLAPIYDTGESLWCDRALANDFRPYTKALYPMPFSTDISSQVERLSLIHISGPGCR